MKTITKEDLKKKMDEKQKFKLVNTLSQWQYDAKHIPGSIHVGSHEMAEEKLDKEDDIVVYCSHKECSASQMAYHMLVNHGYKKVRRYEGGIDEWEEAGFLLVGNMVE